MTVLVPISIIIVLYIHMCVKYKNFIFQIFLKITLR